MEAGPCLHPLRKLKSPKTPSSFRKPPQNAWRKFWQAPPPPMHHDLHALMRIGAIRIEGDVDLLLANMLYLKIMLETLRGKV